MLLPCTSVCNRPNDATSDVLLKIARPIAHKPPFEFDKRRTAALGSPLSEGPLGDAEKFRSLLRRHQLSG
jgi:hypothetical protein